MKTSILLTKKTFIFYSIIGLPIIIGSFYNLIYGVILGQNRTISIGAFSLFGFILLPILLVASYKKNKCIIKNDKIIIGKTEYNFTDYSFKIPEKELQFKDRPIFSIFKNKYHYLIIIENRSGNIVLNQDLDIFKNDIDQLKSMLPLNK